MMAQSIGSAISGTTYPSDDPELVAVEADYAAKEAALQAEIDNIESSHPGYDEYRYDLDMIGHDPHELAAYLSAVLQGYTRASAQAELERIFAAQYQLTLTEEVEVRYRTETRTDSEGNEYDVEVPYNYYILNVTLTSKPISSVASELLTPDQLEMYQVYRQTLGNKPLIFGGGSADTSDSESLAGVEFVNGTRPGNQTVVDIAKSQVGNVGGQPYWSWYGFNSRVEWCACFVSWCYGQMGLSEPRFAACQSQGIPWFQSHGQWGGRDYANIAPGDAIFFDWTWMAAPTMWALLSAPMAAGFTPWKAIRRRLQDQELFLDLRVHQGLRLDELVIFCGGIKTEYCILWGRHEQCRSFSWASSARDSR